MSTLPTPPPDSFSTSSSPSPTQEEKNGDWVDLKKEELASSDNASSLKTLHSVDSFVSDDPTVTNNDAVSETSEVKDIAAGETEKSVDKTLSRDEEEEKEEGEEKATLTTEVPTTENVQVASETDLEPPSTPSEDVVETTPADVDQKAEPVVPETVTEKEQTLGTEPESHLRERRTKEPTPTETSTTVATGEEETEATTPETASQEALPVEAVTNFLLTPGITDGAVTVMNASFAGLFLCLFFLFAITHSYHVVILIFVTAGLFISTQWFLIELKAVKAREAIETETSAKPDVSKTSAKEASINVPRAEEHKSSASKASINEAREKQA